MQFLKRPASSMQRFAARRELRMSWEFRPGGRSYRRLTCRRQSATARHVDDHRDVNGCFRGGGSPIGQFQGGHAILAIGEDYLQQ